MAINYSTQVYRPAYNTFARPVIFNPLVSQPNAGTFTGRGIYNVEPIDVMAEDGSIFSETRTILDVLEEEFTVLPRQGDQVTLPTNAGMPACGTFEVIETKPNGGGELTMILRAIVTAKP